MKHIKRIFLSLMTLMLLIFPTVILFNSVSAQTIYLSSNYDDLSYGDWTRTDEGQFTYQSNGDGYAGYANYADKNIYCYKKVDLPLNYEMFFDFKIVSVDLRIILARVGSSHTGSPSVNIWVDDSNRMMINGVFAENITFDTWHKLLINVTEGKVCRYVLDGGPLTGPYSSVYSYRSYVEYGSSASTTGGTWYVDNWTIASKIGSPPVASFTPSATEGDGLTNFIFTDTSNVGSFFGITSYWDFGDGNYTYGVPLGTVNHTYIHAGNYQVVLNTSNLLGYDIAYTNITVEAINIGNGTGGETISDEMFGFVIVVLLITLLNYIGVKLDALMISLFAFLGMIMAIGLLWQNDPTYISLMIIMTLGNLGLLVYGFVKE